MEVQATVYADDDGGNAEEDGLFDHTDNADNASISAISAIEDEDEDDEDEDEDDEDVRQEDEMEASYSVPAVSLNECAAVVTQTTSWRGLNSCPECFRQRRLLRQSATSASSRTRADADADDSQEYQRRRNIREHEREEERKDPFVFPRKHPFVFPKEHAIEFFIYVMEYTRRSRREKGVTQIEAVALASALRKQCVHRKLRAYFDGIANHMFYSDVQKNQMFRLFCDAQRTYHALQRFRFALQWRTRSRAPTVDLTFAPIATRSRVTVYIDQTVYTFSVDDIVRIVMNALTYIEPYSFIMYGHVKHPKNPYTNVRFSRAAMYTIYFQLFEKRRMPLPSLMMRFFHSDFCTAAMNTQFDEEMHAHHVERYIREMSLTNMRVHGNCMLNYMCSYSEPPICPTVSHEYSTRRFVHELGPAIRNYIRASSMVQFGDAHKKNYERAEVYMRHFLHNNPRFGRVEKKGVRRLRSGACYRTFPLAEDANGLNVAYRQPSSSTE